MVLLVLPLARCSLRRTKPVSCGGWICQGGLDDLEFNLDGSGLDIGLDGPGGEGSMGGFFDPLEVRSRSSSPSMISESSKASEGSSRFDLSSDGALLLAQARAREPERSSINGDGSGGGGGGGGGVFAIIDDYFEASDGGAMQGDLDALERSMLAVLEQEEVTHQAPPAFTLGTPPPGASPSRQRKGGRRKSGGSASSHSPSSSFFGGLFGSSGRSRTSSTWHSSSRKGAKSPQNTGAGALTGSVPAGAAGSGPIAFPRLDGGGGLGGAGALYGGANASWSAGMGQQQLSGQQQQQLQLQVQQMQLLQFQQAQALARGGHLPLAGVTVPPPSGLGAALQSGSGPRVAELSARIEALRATVGITPHQRVLAQTILNRGDMFLTGQFAEAISAAEKGRPERLFELLRMATTLSISMQQQSPPHQQSQQLPLHKSLQPPIPPPQSQLQQQPQQQHQQQHPLAAPSPVVPPPLQHQLPPGAVASAACEGVGLQRHVSPDWSTWSDERIVAAANEAAASGQRPQLETAVAALEAMALRKRAMAVELRDAGQFDAALKAMKEMKTADALLESCRGQL